MRLSRNCLTLFVLLLIAAASVSANTIVSRPIVRGSGHGGACSDGAQPCVDSSLNGTTHVSTLIIGDNGPGGFETLNYQLFQVSGIAAGSVVDFTFGNPANPLYDNSGNQQNDSLGIPLFGALPCGTDSLGKNPNIYTAAVNGHDSVSLGLACTDSKSDLESFITKLVFTLGNNTQTLSFTFGGTGLPSTWVFAESQEGPTYIPQSVPEPSLFVLMCCGFALLGACLLGKSRL